MLCAIIGVMERGGEECDEKISLNLLLPVKVKPIYLVCLIHKHTNYDDGVKGVGF